MTDAASIVAMPAPALRYPRIIAHRGGGALAPENTLVGMRIAHRLGCRGVECDVMLTADGVPILMHDETLERTTNGVGPVAAATAAQIDRLDAGGKHHPAFAVSPAPTFIQVLALCSELGLWLNAEIKPTAGTDAATGRAVAAIAAAHLAQYPATAMVLSSFSAPALQAAMAVAPAIPRALLCADAPADWQAALAACDAAALHLPASIRHADLRAICADDVPVACYTVNDRATAETLFAAGVCAIFTDRPDLWPAAEM